MCINHNFKQTKEQSNFSNSGALLLVLKFKFTLCQS